MSRRVQFAIVVWSIFFVAFVAHAASETFTGTVIDATTHKPAAGDEVVLLDFSKGMQVLGRTRSDSNGGFTLSAPHSKQTRLLGVIHQGTSYFELAPASAKLIRMNVYDVSAKVKGIAVTADVTRFFQTKGNVLHAVRLFEVKNNSMPPQTQMSEHNFEFYLPEGAQIDQSIAQMKGGQPTRTSAVPQKEKNLFAFVFPLRPGETEFQVLYHMAYNGAVTVDPRPVYDAEHLVVMLPKQMQFSAPFGEFKTITDPRQSDTIVQVASNTTVGQPLAFTLSGTATLADTKKEDAGSLKSTDTPPSGSTIQPPGTRTVAMVSPIPGPSERSQWYVLGGLGLLLAAGTLSIARRSAKRRVPRHFQGQIQDDIAPSDRPSNSKPGEMLVLEGLKEHLFQLEVDHKRQRISQSEYETGLAALHQNLQHAIGEGNGKTLN